MYENNRHNVGFKVIELLSGELDLSLKKKAFRPYLYGSAMLKGQRIVLIKPLTYMNRSGEIFPSLFRTFNMTSENLLVLCDNLDLPPGRCKLKLKGSPAAHNGLKSISSRLGSNDYMRIFIGIGHPGNRDDVRDWVLGDPEEEDLPFFEQSWKNCADAVFRIALGQSERVMNELNRKNTDR